MFDGLEIDMLSLGDADCIIVTCWVQFTAYRILIDGGKAADYPLIRDFLLSKGMTYFYAAVCTHTHEDHAAGLIKIIQDTSFNFSTGWMHDIRKHASDDALRRASSGTSDQAKGVKQVLETTKELASAFASRKITPQEPFAGLLIAGYPALTVLGPSLPFYNQKIAEFTKVEESSLPNFWRALAAASPAPAAVPMSRLLEPPATLGKLYGSSPWTTPSVPVPLAGVLKNSSVEKKPTTQPFNETSVILGTVFNSRSVMFTGDAGSEALDRVLGWNNLHWMQVPHHGSDGNLSKTNIERFCPTVAFVSACGDESHPDSAIKNGLIKVGSTVYSTHSNSNLWYWIGSVPARPDYSPAIPLKGTADPVVPNLAWLANVPSR